VEKYVMLKREKEGQGNEDEMARNKGGEGRKKQ
jgi:hypothetical protein